MFREIDNNSNGYAMPGWETERMGEIKELFEKYKNVTSEDLWNNLEYFLNRLMPVCEECDVKMLYIRTIRHGEYSACRVL